MQSASVPKCQDVIILENENLGSVLGMNPGETVYQENDAGSLVSEMFSGGISVEEALDRLRSRLLDMSSRNSLLNYRHPRASCLQIADEPNLNLVFDRLYASNRAVPVKYVTEPDLQSYTGKRPEARIHASRLGIRTEFEFAPSSEGADGRRLHGIQALLYPTELERHLRKMASAAKSAIEETGTNMLFMMFGFLEFYESDSSDRPMLAPLLSLPVALERGDIDPETRTYRYSLQYNGEDLAENHTLREKLQREFTLQLPEFEEEDEPETYFKRIETAFRTRARWKVRRQLTLGFLSFGKIAIWSDLDHKRNPGLVQHPLVRSIFSGGQSNGDSLHAEDYRIDERPEADEPLIYEADSSQHSAIIDVLSGRSIVVDGPPGCGKSQTITNVIAAALSKGKKVLFVSEKLAALEVVRARLNKADLGHFCLELHSHKTQKKKLLEDIKARIEHTFAPPAQFQARLETLRGQRRTLARYAELMGSRVGNGLGLTINEIFWSAERRRQALGEQGAHVYAITFGEASRWSPEDIKARSTRLFALGAAYDAIGQYDQRHPWWGFSPEDLSPSDDDAVARIVAVSLEDARSLDELADEVAGFFGLDHAQDLTTMERIRDRLDALSGFPDEGDPVLLPRLFDERVDPNGHDSARVIETLTKQLERACELRAQARTVLTQDGIEHLPPIEAIEADLENRAPLLGDLDAHQALDRISDLERCLVRLDRARIAARTPDRVPSMASSEALLSACQHAPHSKLGHFPISRLAEHAERLEGVVKALERALNKVQAIVEKRSIAFDASPAAIERLSQPDGLEGLIKGQQIDSDILERARKCASYLLGDRSLADIERIKGRLAADLQSATAALARCREAATRIGLEFTPTDDALKALGVLSSVCSTAPIELLEYRSARFGTARATELIDKVRSSLQVLKNEQARFEQVFYLDALPAVEQIKASALTLRRDEGLFLFFDGNWRSARQFHVRLSREKRKLTSRQRAEELSGLAAWIEARQAFVEAEELKTTFGALFRGLDTDPEPLTRLNLWYRDSQALLVQRPGLIDQIDLSALSASRVIELAAKRDEVVSDVDVVLRLDPSLRSVIKETDLAPFLVARRRSWDEALEVLQGLIRSLETVLSFCNVRIEHHLSPRDMARLMDARFEFDTIADDIAFLMDGHRQLRDAAAQPLALLVEGEVSSWSRTIDDMRRDLSGLDRVLADAKTHAHPDALLAEAHDLASACHALAGAWLRIARPPVASDSSDWRLLQEAGNDLVQRMRQHLAALLPNAREGVSVRAVVGGWKSLVSAHHLIDEIGQDARAKAILGDRFEGFETALPVFSQTHRWGRQICESRLPNFLRRRLLGPDSMDALAFAQGAYRQMAKLIRAVRSELDGLQSFGEFAWDDWIRPACVRPESIQPAALRCRLEHADASGEGVLSWSKYLTLRRLAEAEGLVPFVTLLEAGKLAAGQLPLAFEFSAYQSIGRSLYQDYPELRRFSGQSHEKTQADYRALDAEITRLAGRDTAYRIEAQTRIPQGERGSTVGEFTEMHLLRREIAKQRRHIPIRQLIKRAGHALVALKPCFMMGPLSLAQYLDQGAIEFDLVVMDEASQLRPEDAMGAIARGGQLVVVGDPKQLPPTNFFNRLLDANDDEDEEAPAAISGMESILDICRQLFTPVRSLRWHYRSQHESLIAFSNFHFYKNLVVFPSPYAKHPGLGVKYHHVRNGVYASNQNAPEAQRLVDAVLAHMMKRPDESLGIVTLNQTQSALIEELLEQKLKNFEEGARYLDRWETEGWPLFIKNLENVQGDERDVIFISTTFGKAPGAARVAQRFGPINKADGWRRLNVLFTRAKRRIELFSSMLPEDVLVDEKASLGRKALRDYLDFAKRGILVSTDENERAPDSDFEVSVANVVTSLGYEVKPQLGVAGFFIDMAVRNPDRPGEYLAAIECDGATYHSGASVRDRDRIRQEILESLGWKGKIHRIWSTDWFYDPRREIARLESFLEMRRALSVEAKEWIDYEVLEPEEILPAEAEIPDVFDAPGAAVAQHREAVIQPDSLQDLYVEVGDRVTYCLMDNKEQKHSVQIVDSESNAKMGLINEETPLAHALIGLSPGEIGTIEVSGQPPRQICVLKILRQGELTLDN